MPWRSVPLTATTWVRPTAKFSSFNGVNRTALTTPAVTNVDWKFAQRADRIWLSPAEIRAGQTIYAWDGTDLTAVDPGIPATTRLTTFNVFSEEDILLAGYKMDDLQSLTRHYNGTTWSNVSFGFGTGRLIDVVRSGDELYTINGSTWYEGMECYLGSPFTSSNIYYESQSFKALAAADNGTVLCGGQGWSHCGVFWR